MQKKLRIVGVSIVGEGEGKRYLKEVLKEKSRLCDKIVILAHCPDILTENVCKSFSKVVYYWTNEKEIWATKQWQIKEWALQLVSKENPDWILAFDADELMDYRVDRKVLENLAFKKYNSYYFRFVHLWNNKRHIRIDGSWDRLYKVIFYKYQKDKEQKFRRSALHCGVAPLYAHQSPGMSGYLVKHYGYMKLEDRDKKVERYNKYDPRGFYKPQRWYNSIKEEGKIIIFDEKEFVKSIFSNSQNYG